MKKKPSIGTILRIKECVRKPTKFSHVGEPCYAVQNVETLFE